jgi:hypothetical protein
MHHVLTQFAATCAEPSFFGVPTWYKYLNTERVAGMDVCNVKFTMMKNGVFYYMDLLLVALGILDILLRIAALVALAFIIYGGFKYITSQGSPDGAKAAQNTILNAVIGLAIAILAAAIVSFIGRAVSA